MSDFERFESVPDNKEDVLEDDSERAREAELFGTHLNGIFEKLRESGLNWRVVGGVAIDGLTKESVEPRRGNGTIRDADVMILDTAPEKVKELEAFFKDQEAKWNDVSGEPAVYPEVSFVGEVKTEEYSQRKEKIMAFPQLMAHLLKKQDDFFLQFRELEEKLDPQVLQPHEATIAVGGREINMQTFLPQTITHLYLQRMGYIKPKDMEKLKEFMRKINESEEGGSDALDHDLYLPFHKFAKDMRQRYKITTKALELYAYIDHRYFQSLLSHKFIPREILDVLLKA